MNRFSKTVPGVVKEFRPHHEDDLEWQEPGFPEPMTYAEAEVAIKKLNDEKFGGTDTWRLPVVEEEFLLADRTTLDPAIDTKSFPTCKSGAYWTSSPDPSVPDCVFVVNFYHGSVLLGYRYYRCRVRAVRSVSRASQ